MEEQCIDTDIEHVQLQKMLVQVTAVVTVAEIGEVMAIGVLALNPTAQAGITVQMVPV